PSATLALPDGVAPADVRGLEFRFTSTDGTIDASGAAGSVKFAVTQRAGIPTDVTTEVPNTVHATVESPKGTATDTASADLTIAPLSVSVAATKKFTPTTVKAGESSTVEVAARNASNHALTSLTITEPAPGTTDLAANGLAFTGFGANGDGAVNLPTGA